MKRFTHCNGLPRATVALVRGTGTSCLQALKKPASSSKGSTKPADPLNKANEGAQCNPSTLFGTICRKARSASSCASKRCELFDGSDVTGDLSQYPPFDHVLAKCREMRASTLVLLDSLTEEDLDKVCPNAPEGYEDTFGTYRLCLQLVADHWYMHRGQLADARRAAGLERMWL